MRVQSPLIAKQRELMSSGYARPTRRMGTLGLGTFGAVSTIARPIATTATTAATGAAVAGTSAAIGAGSAIGLGAAAGSVVPIIGTAVGAIIGLVASGVFNKKQDPEQRNFDQAIALWQQNPMAVLSIANKYLALAGFFDLTNSQAGKIRIYRKYGRMGEQRFVNDFVGKIYQAAQSGAIGPTDTPQSVYQKVILPWEDSWGFGPEPPNPHSGFMDLLLMGMIADYVAGNQRLWTARSGDYPFTSLPAFALPAAQLSAPAKAVPVATPTTPTTPIAATSTTVTPSVNQVYSNNGATLTAGLTGTNVGLKDQYGNTWSLGPAQSGGLAPVYLNGHAVSNAGGSLSARTLLLYNGTLYVKPTANATWGDSTPAYAYSPSGFAAVNDPTTTASSTLVGTATGVAVPAGYSLVGTANGLGAYQGLDGNLYSWSGTAMTLLTGTLTTPTGASVSVVNGVPQAAGASSLPSLSSAGQQSYNSASAPYYPDTSQAGASAASTPAPAVSTPVTAGLSGWVGWVGVAALAGMIYFGSRKKGSFGIKGAAHGHQ